MQTCLKKMRSLKNLVFLPGYLKWTEEYVAHILRFILNNQVEKPDF